MELKLIAMNGEAEQAFIDGCVEAIVKHDISHAHVLARHEELLVYLLSTDEITFDTLIMYKGYGPMEFECILGQKMITHFYRAAKESSSAEQTTRERFVNFLKAMRECIVISN